MKWSNYYNVFEQYFPSSPTNILEIGVNSGSGLRFLRDKFPNSNIFGIDYAITPSAIIVAKECNVKLYSINQCKLGNCLFPPFDLVLDDGGHRPYQQAASFRALWPNMPEGAVYMIEDMHMNFRWHWRLYGMFFGIIPLLLNMIRKQNKWRGGEQTMIRSPKAIIFTPQLVTLIKGEVNMYLK